MIRLRNPVPAGPFLQPDRCGYDGRTRHPGAVVITDPFVDVCERVADRMGYAGYRPIMVPHPAASRSDEWLREWAERSIAVLVSQVLPEGSAQNQGDAAIRRGTRCDSDLSSIQRGSWDPPFHARRGRPAVPPTA